MAADRDALLQHYQQMRETLFDTIAGLSDEQLCEASLDGWSVKDHLAHIALWDDLRASEVVRISAGHDSAWRMTEEQGDAYNALAYAVRRDLTLDQARWELASSRQWLLDAIAAATGRGLEPGRYAEAALRSDHEAQHTGWIKRWRTERGL